MHQPYFDRRSFLKLAAANAALVVGASATARGFAQVGNGANAMKNGKLNVAFIGVSGKGSSNVTEVAGHDSVHAIAMCDVDRNHLAGVKAKFPEAKQFTDYRELFDALGDQIDAVVVSTPDHTHAPASMMALNRGKHVYCEKPLTHDVYEARQLAAISAKNPSLSTQMGTQNIALENKRQAIAIMSDPDLRKKTVGTVRAIYGWSDRPAGWWPQGIAKPEKSDPIPDHLEWDLWLGTAPKREYVDGMYAHFNWRGVFDFGCGALGDMACHILDVPYYGLDLGHATSVVSHCEDATDDRFPNHQQVIVIYPASDASGGQDIPLYWSDGGLIPHFKATRIAPEFDATENATVIVGDRGSLHVAHPEGMPRLFVEKDGGFIEEDITSMLPRFEPRNHYHHWVDVALGKEKETQCRFTVSGPMTEGLCLGSIAARFPHKTLIWNAEAMKFENDSDATSLVRRTYRKGFEVENL